MKLALSGFVALSWEHLVANADFDIVSLSREDQQRFVLSLPAETRDRSVVSVFIFCTLSMKGLNPVDPSARYANAFRVSEEACCLIIHVVYDCLIINVLD